MIDAEVECNIVVEEVKKKKKLLNNRKETIASNYNNSNYNYNFSEKNQFQSEKLELKSKTVNLKISEEDFLSTQRQKAEKLEVSGYKQNVVLKKTKRSTVKHELNEKDKNRKREFQQSQDFKNILPYQRNPPSSKDIETERLELTQTIKSKKKLKS